jgi:hypothetical protein
MLFERGYKENYLASVFSCDVFIIRLGLKSDSRVKIPLKVRYFQGDTQVFRRKFGLKYKIIVRGLETVLTRPTCYKVVWD